MLEQHKLCAAQMWWSFTKSSRTQTSVVSNTFQHLRLCKMVSHENTCVENLLIKMCIIVLHWSVLPLLQSKMSYVGNIRSILNGLARVQGTLRDLTSRVKSDCFVTAFAASQPQIYHTICGEWNQAIREMKMQWCLPSARFLCRHFAFEESDCKYEYRAHVWHQLEDVSSQG